MFFYLYKRDFRTICYKIFLFFVTKKGIFPHLPTFPY